jgi:predicted kinase
MKRVIIMRGISGSGKSHHAALFAGNGRVVSADDYFMHNGVYVFNARKLSEAHTACMQAFLNALHQGYQTVVVDNTNIRLHELNPYRMVALAMGYDVEIYHIICPVSVAFKRGQHRVPHNSLVRQEYAYEILPGFMGVENEIINAIE